LEVKKGNVGNSFWAHPVFCPARGWVRGNEKDERGHSPKGGGSHIFKEKIEKGEKSRGGTSWGEIVMGLKVHLFTAFQETQGRKGERGNSGGDFPWNDCRFVVGGLEKDG